MGSRRVFPTESVCGVCSNSATSYFNPWRVYLCVKLPCDLPPAQSAEDQLVRPFIVESNSRSIPPRVKATALTDSFQQHPTPPIRLVVSRVETPQRHTCDRRRRRADPPFLKQTGRRL